jgi:DNA (cytosine-5)-methyltransferase 1
MIDVHMVGQMDNSEDHTFDMANRVYGADGIAPTLHTCGGGMTHTKVLAPERGTKGDIAMAKQHYRIRKLTPKECFRLMGVRDEDYDKLTVSDTQKYKQAGNSIVVDVLQAIFENMFVNECKKNRLF